MHECRLLKNVFCVKFESIALIMVLPPTPHRAEISTYLSFKWRCAVLGAFCSMCAIVWTLLTSATRQSTDLTSATRKSVVSKVRKADMAKSSPTATHGSITIPTTKSASPSSTSNSDIASINIALASSTSSSSSSSSTSSSTSIEPQMSFRRDGSLASLVNLLNSDEAAHMFQNWNANPDAGRFLKIISPWVINGDFATPLKLGGQYRPEPVVTDCGQPRYGAVLTGAPLKTLSRRWIVDFIAFGYDAEKLLIRLYETFDEVDIYVIYEAPFTLMTARKPLYFEELRRQPRFRPFLRKIVHIIAREKDMVPSVNMARSAFEREEKVFREGGVFSVELFQMKDMIRRFIEIDPSTNALKRDLDDFVARGGVVLATQADADELIHREALHHTARCELRPSVESIYMPCFSFKSNMYWLQRTFDMGCMKSADKADTAAVSSELNTYLWRLGPYVWPLSSMLQAVSSLRRNYTVHACIHHMGYGAGVHLSSFTDPAEHFLKACGTIENYHKCSRSVHTDLVAAGRIHNITAELVFRTIVKPWCHKRHTAVHVSTLSARAQAVVRYATPQIVKDNPRSFPFIMPSAKDDGGEVSAGLFRQCAEPSFTRSCPWAPFKWPIIIDIKHLVS